jgi:hypothetical protein
MRLGIFTALLFCLVASGTCLAEGPLPAVGAAADTGCGKSPQKVQRLQISKAGTYENYLVDGRWVERNLVKITSSKVILRNSEIRNGGHNAVAVYSDDVLIEGCRIHHLLAGTFAEQKDAHGVTGRPGKLTIRNCEIYLVSGDCLQFDPGRGPWGEVLVENCTFWTGPLPAAGSGFRKGEVPGENAVDTKQLAKNPRSRMILRRCLFYGWKNGPIRNMAAVNLKENVRVSVEDCIFRDNEISFRLRGGSTGRGGALVDISDCAVYRSAVALRIEDGILDLKIRRLGIGAGVLREIRMAGGGAGRGFRLDEKYEAPPVEDVLQVGPASFLRSRKKA